MKLGHLVQRCSILFHICTVVHNCHDNNKKKKISQIKKFCSHKKKVYFHINKICSHIQRRICLHIQTTHGKWPRQILARQIPTANPHGKFSRQIPTANSQICIITEDGAEYPLCGRASRVKIKRKQVTKHKFIKAMRIN